MSNTTLKFLNTCACVEGMDKITTRVYLRMLHEWDIGLVTRDLIPTFGEIALKVIISNLNAMRDAENHELAAYINISDLMVFGSVELNFKDTEKVMNILPDFRLGKRGCEIAGIDYEKYIKTQRPLNHYKSRVIETGGLEDTKNRTWKELLESVNQVIKAKTRFLLDDIEITAVFIEIFLEEILRYLFEHREVKNFSYKVYDLLYFETTDDPSLWGIDVMPEYKLMVKDDSYLEESVEQMIEEEHRQSEGGDYDSFKGLESLGTTMGSKSGTGKLHWN